MSVLAEIRDLRVDFPTSSGWQPAVRGVSLTLGREKLGIVGESGSGKSVTGRALMKLLPPQARIAATTLRVADTDVLRASRRDMRKLRGRHIGLILQDPKFSLNPVMTAGAQIAEAWRAHRGGGKREAHEAALDLLRQVLIRDPARVAGAYPHELSGGMGQRVMIAMMLAPGPEILIADEPTSALDATVQAEILRLIDRLVSERGMGLILISHDLPLVARYCDRILVMNAGRVVETCVAAELDRATHPYTRGLLAAVPRMHETRAELPVLDRSEWAGT
jgi:peptide/nickel transport system ATP-binding protein